MKQDFLDIPELVTHLALYLSPADLLSCVQLNSTWNTAFIPFLWRSIDDSTHSWGDILLQITHPRPQPQSPATTTEEAIETTPNNTSFDVSAFDLSRHRDSDYNKDRDWLFAIFEKYGHHIRELKIQSPLILEAASRKETCTRLHTLVLGLDMNVLGPRTEYLPLLPLPPQPPLLPILPGLGTVDTPPADDGLGAAPDLPAFEGFEVEPAAVDAHGFDTTSVDQVEDPDQEPDAELSDPLFPDHLTLADLIITKRDERVTPESDKARKEYMWIIAQHTWHLIRTNPGLVRIVTSRCYRFYEFDISDDFIFTTLRLLKHLKDLSGNEYLFKDLHFWRLWDALPAKIESLSIIDSRPPPSVFPLPDPLPKVNTSLKVLLAGGSTTINGLLTLLSIFPNLTRLRLQNVEKNPESMSSPNYTPQPPSPFGGQYLRKLEGSVEDWETVFHYIPSIVEWDAQGKPLDEDLALHLKDHCPNLESFKQQYQPWFIDERDLAGIRGNDPTNQFLITHRHLRVFDSIENFIKVDEMLREPWTCMGLEWLTCRIVGLDRLTPEEEVVVARVIAPEYMAELSAEERGVVEKFNRCRTQHHGVYDRLASLSRLKHLDLGYENRYPWEYKSGEVYEGEDGEEYLTYDPPTFDTLELTLESGLGRLGALKDLEMFGFECINHRIGKAELEWMAKSWPKLNLMYGLDRERLDDIEHDKDRAALREYFSTLRPDVVHDSLFQDDI